MSIIDENRRHIEAALAYSGGTHEFEDVRWMIETGRAQIWVGPDGCAVTEILQFPRKKILHCFLAGGKMGQITDMLDSALAWGRAQGCEAFTIAGRSGWKRVLAPHGFKEVLVTLEREIPAP